MVKSGIIKRLDICERHMFKSGRDVRKENGGKSFISFLLYMESPCWCGNLRRPGRLCPLSRYIHPDFRRVSSHRQSRIFAGPHGRSRCLLARTAHTMQLFHSVLLCYSCSLAPFISSLNSL